MLTKREHLEIIIKYLEKFDTTPESSYNFVEFFDRCAVIFDVSTQNELANKVVDFQKEFRISIFEAQTHLFNKRVLGFSGIIRIKVVDEGDLDNIDTDRFVLNLNLIEARFRSIYIWCRKQIVKIVKDQDLSFDRLYKNDLSKSD